MKKRILIVSFLLLVNFLMAQVGINTTSPHDSAELDVSSTSKGLLIPRLTTAVINTLAATASEGLIVFDTTRKRFLGFNGTSWQIFQTSTLTSGPTTATFAFWEMSGITSADNYGASSFAGTLSNPSQITSASLTRGSGEGLQEVVVVQMHGEVMTLTSQQTVWFPR